MVTYHKTVSDQGRIQLMTVDIRLNPIYDFNYQLSDQICISN